MTSLISQLTLNTACPNIMWIDLNSAFAKIEQQAHPHLRHRPVGITNRLSDECCIITSSYEARARGVRTGMRRREAMVLCPELILLESDPAKYYSIYQKLFSIMQSYSPTAEMRSIDEGLIDLNHTAYANNKDKLITLAHEIKKRVSHEIGDYITVNIGLGPNRFLAKLAAGLHKPDGFDVIDYTNLENIYSHLRLTDLAGIAQANAHRLLLAGINTPLEFLNSDEFTLRTKVFHGINGTYWYKRLRGYEVDDRPTKDSMIGRQWVIDNPTSDSGFIAACLHCLVESNGFSLRSRQLSARGVCVWLAYQNGLRFHRKQLASLPIRHDSEIWQVARQLLDQSPNGLKVRLMGTYLYNLVNSSTNQLSFLHNSVRRGQISQASDHINNKYGPSTIHSADSNIGIQHIKRKVPFGSTRYFDLLENI